LDRSPWKLRSRETIFENPPWIRAERHEIELPDGKIIPDWVWIDTPDFVNVLAITEHNEVLCFLQNKYAIEGLSYAPVGGYINAHELPEQAAKRELLEETGYAAERWKTFGKFAADGNRGAGNGYLFLAMGAKKVAEICVEDLEEMQLLKLSMAEFESHVIDGDFKLLPWAACAAMALLHLKSSSCT
jgi:ADP-ribose pyrophosphatase